MSAEEQGLNTGEIDALPVGSIIEDRDEDRYERRPIGWIIIGGGSTPFEASTIAHYQPVRLITTP